MATFLPDSDHALDCCTHSTSADLLPTLRLPNLQRVQLGSGYCVVISVTCVRQRRQEGPYNPVMVKRGHAAGWLFLH